MPPGKEVYHKTRILQRQDLGVFVSAKSLKTLDPTQLALCFGSQIFVLFEPYVFIFLVKFA